MSDCRKSPALKLAKLPVRKPIKMTIALSAELADQLNAYAAAYRQTYGEAETPAALVPFILHTFLESDRAFCRSARLAGRSGKPVGDKADRVPENP